MVIKKGRKAQWLQNLRKVEKVPRQKKGTPKKEQLGINRTTVLFLDDGTRIKRRMGLIRFLKKHGANSGEGSHSLS